MNTLYLFIMGVFILTFLSLQTANAQSQNVTKFNVLTSSIFIGENNNIEKFTNSSKIVQSVGEVIEIAKGGLTYEESKSKSIILNKINNSTQIVDGDIAPVILERQLVQASSLCHCEVLFITFLWIYYIDGSSLHGYIISFIP